MTPSDTTSEICIGFIRFRGGAILRFDDEETFKGLFGVIFIISISGLRCRPFKTGDRSFD